MLAASVGKSSIATGCLTRLGFHSRQSEKPKKADGGNCKVSLRYGTSRKGLSQKFQTAEKFPLATRRAELPHKPQTATRIFFNFDHGTFIRKSAKRGLRSVPKRDSWVRLRQVGLITVLAAG